MSYKVEMGNANLLEDAMEDDDDDGSVIVLCKSSDLNSFEFETLAKTLTGPDKILPPVGNAFEVNDADIITMLDVVLEKQKHNLEHLKANCGQIKGIIASLPLPAGEPHISELEVQGPHSRHKNATLEDHNEMVDEAPDFNGGTAGDVEHAEMEENTHIHSYANTRSEDSGMTFTETNDSRTHNNNNPPDQGSNKGNVGIQSLIQHYHRSLDTVSRYIILASIISFVTAFALLTWYSSQTHRHDMEIFQLKEKQIQAQHSSYEKSQSQSERFRETLVHQRYEETRECQKSLKTCHSKHEELKVMLTKVEKEALNMKFKLESELVLKGQEIQGLKETIKALKQRTDELKAEVAGSSFSIMSQILTAFLNLLKDRTIIATFILSGGLLLGACIVAGK